MAEIKPRDPREDQLALDVLTRFEDGLWAQSHGQPLIEEFGLWGYIKFTWLQWRCIRRGWLEYEAGSLGKYGWIRITREGRIKLLEARRYRGSA